MSQVNAKTLMLGQNADQAKNFKITVPTPEDGTLTIERGNGTDVIKVAANGVVSFPQMPRTWKTKAISAGVNYTNNSGADIDLAITMTSTSGSSTMALETDGGVRICIAKAEQNVSNGMLFGTIPAGGIFVVNGVAGSVSTLQCAVLMFGPATGITP